jgi:hypothetical protein
MIIEINEEEWEFVLRVCVRAKAMVRMNILKEIDYIDAEKDLKKIDSLIDKLEKAKDA